MDKNESSKIPIDKKIMFPPYAINYISDWD